MYYLSINVLYLNNRGRAVFPDIQNPLQFSRKQHIKQCDSSSLDY